jgi:hypothetical protein
LGFGRLLGTDDLLHSVVSNSDKFDVPTLSRDAEWFNAALPVSCSVLFCVFRGQWFVQANLPYSAVWTTFLQDKLLPKKRLKVNTKR